MELLKSINVYLTIAKVDGKNMGSLNSPFRIRIYDVATLPSEIIPNKDIVVKNILAEPNLHHKGWYKIDVSNQYCPK